jgi:hypothetical protein
MDAEAKSNIWKCLLNEEAFSMNSNSDVMEAIARIQQSQYAEVWVEAPAGDSLCVLLNSRRAFIMYLRYKGDSGKHAYDSGDVNDLVDQDFQLANGEVNEFHPSDTVFREAGLRAIRDFYQTGEPAHWLKWREP